MKNQIPAPSARLLQAINRSKMPLCKPCCMIAFLVWLSQSNSFVRADDRAGALQNAKSKADAARKVYEGLMENLKTPTGVQDLDVEKLYTWSHRWMEAERDAGEKQADRLKAIEAHLTRMKGLEKTLRALDETGQVGSASVTEGEFFRLEAEGWVMEARKK